MCRTKKQIRKCTTIERYHAHRVLFTINIVVKPKLSSELNRESEKRKIQKELNKTTKKTGKLSQEYVRENASGTRVCQSEMATILEQRNEITPVDAR